MMVVWLQTLLFAGVTVSVRQSRRQFPHTVPEYLTTSIMRAIRPHTLLWPEQPLAPLTVVIRPHTAL